MIDSPSAIRREKREDHDRYCDAHARVIGCTQGFVVRPNVEPRYAVAIDLNVNIAAFPTLIWVPTHLVLRKTIRPPADLTAA